MSEALVLDRPHIHHGTTRKLSDLEQQITTRPLRQAEAVTRIDTRSLSAAILSTLLMRVASRVSFVLLGFYLGEHFTSATLVAVVLEAFYLSELVLAPLVGNLSDSLGRKPFLLSAPLVGGAAALCFLGATLLFPHPHASLFDLRLAVLLLLILVGRLLEGAATALNGPTSLSYITEVSSHSDQLRARVMTAFEVVTVAGLALAIPLGGTVSSVLGTWGFFVVVALHLLNALLIASSLREQTQHKAQANTHHSLLESLVVIRHKRIFPFLPAWLTINALVGAWLTLGTILLTYPAPAAHLRHPGQLLYGGFSKEFATSLLGGFGLLFLLGMGLWLLVLPHLRRTTIMLMSLGGLSLSIFALSFINALGGSLTSLLPDAHAVVPLLLAFVVLGILLLSGFTPASLTQMAAISELLPGKRGAVMGLYSVVMGIGQLIGAALGGLSVDLAGFYGLMGFSIVMGLISLASVLFMRLNGHDVNARGS